MVSELVNSPTGRIYQAGAGEYDLTDRLRDAARESLYVFAKAVMHQDLLTPKLHKPLCDKLQTVPPRHKMVLWPRGCYKTTIASCLAVHQTIQQAESNPYFPGRNGRNLRMLFASETTTLANITLGWIKQQFEMNQRFRDLYPEVVWPRLSDAPMWTATRFAVPRASVHREGTFEAVGVDSGVTGRHYDVIFKDDIIGLKARQEPAHIPSAIEWFKTSFALVNDPVTALDYVFGTRWAVDDLYSWMMVHTPDYELTKLAIRDSSGHSVFPERYPDAKIAELEATQGELFLLNYMNTAAGVGLTAFDLAMVNYFTLDVRDGIEYADFDESAKVRDIMEIIEGGKPVAAEKPKKIWEMTPNERSERWLAFQRNWNVQRQRRAERGDSDLFEPLQPPTVKAT